MTKGLSPSMAAPALPDGSDVWRQPPYSEIVRTALERYPSRSAFVHAGRTWTYREAADTIAHTERALGRIGIDGGDGVAVLSGNCPEGWIAEQAAMALGTRLIPLRPLGGLDDQAFACEDAEVKTLVFEASAFDQRAADLQARLPGLRLLSLGRSDVAPDLLSSALDEPGGRIQVQGDHGDVACIPYTGGTTGRPKGVMLPHRSMLYNFWLELAGHQWPDRPRFLAVTPITHAAFLMIAPALSLGGTVVLHDGFDPERFIADVSAQGITTTFTVPSMLYALLDHPAFEPKKLASLVNVLYGAAAISPVRIEQALDALGQVFVQMYAQTEAPNTAVALRKEDHDLTRPHLLGSCGKPLVGVEVEIHDPDELECAVGDVGEVVIRGPLVMDGYWMRPRETAEALRGGWLHTGDLARRDEEGYIYVVDRLKDLITTGGVHVYPHEIEDVLAAHPAVATVAVIGIPDETLGEAVKAVVVRRPGTAIGPDELMTLVREKKGPASTPQTVEFVDSIALTGLGKPDKKKLRELHAGVASGPR